MITSIREVSYGPGTTILSLKDRPAYLNHVGNKAKNQAKISRLKKLDRIIKVPNSFLLDYSFYRLIKSVKKKSYKRTLKDLLEFLSSREDLSENLAIRSSSNLEDSMHFSFAGHFLTKLKIKKENKSIENAIFECIEHFERYGSFYDSHTENSLRGKLDLGLVVQDMIDAAYTGVLFTVSPENPDQRKYHIEYCQGIGDSFIRGEKQGVSLIVEKGDKIVDAEDSSGKELNDHYKALTLAANILEESFCSPQDIEFVISRENVIYLLQSRPITAYSYSPEYIEAEEKRKLKKQFCVSEKLYKQSPVFSSTNIAELFPKAVPLSYSIFKYVFAGTLGCDGAINVGRSQLGYARISRREQVLLFSTVGDQARTNLIVDALTFRIKGIDKDLYIQKAIDDYLKKIKEDTRKANYPEAGLYLQEPNRSELIRLFGKKQGARYQKVYARFTENLFSEFIPNWLNKWQKKLEYNHSYFLLHEQNELKNFSISELILLKKKHVEYLRTNFGVEYVIVARIAFFSAFLLKEKLNSVFLSKRSQYGGGNTPAETFVTCLYDGLLKEAGSHSSRGKALTYWSQHKKAIREWGSQFDSNRSTGLQLGSLDISKPRCEKSHFVGVAENISTMSNLRENNACPHSETDRKKIYETICSENPEIFKLLDITKTFLELREVFKLELLKIFNLIKNITDQIAAHSNIGEAIYYLEIQDLFKYSEFQGLLCEELKEKNRQIHNGRNKAIRRRAYFEASKLEQIKKVIVSPKDFIQKIDAPTYMNNGISSKCTELSGTTIYYGEVEGYCLKADSTDELFQKIQRYRDKGINNIVGVFKGLDFSYFSLRHISGLITEHGGYLSHAATLARECGIPYIVDINIDLIPDGSFLKLDSKHQKVLVLDQPFEQESNSKCVKTSV